MDSPESACPWPHAKLASAELTLIHYPYYLLKLPLPWPLRWLQAIHLSDSLCLINTTPLERGSTRRPPRARVNTMPLKIADPALVDSLACHATGLPRLVPATCPGRFAGCARATRL